jgi:hypothetical protein
VSFVSAAEGLEKAVRGLCVRPEDGLPALLAVEMVRLAVRESTGERSRRAAVELRSLNWAGDAATPLAGRISVDVHPTGDGRFDFEVSCFGAPGEAGASAARLCEGAGHCGETGDPGRIDVTNLRKLFRGGHREADACYDFLREAGLERERLPRGVVASRLGDGQHLLEFRLPDDCADELRPFALLSFAQLACLGLLADRGVPAPSVTIASLERIVCSGSASGQGVVWARPARGSRQQEGEAALDVDVLDADGRVLLKLKGLQVGYPAALDAQRMRAVEFEALVDALYSALEPRPDGGPAPPSATVEFRDMLDEIYEARTIQ